MPILLLICKGALQLLVLHAHHSDQHAHAQTALACVLYCGLKPLMSLFIIEAAMRPEMC